MTAKVHTSLRLPIELTVTPWPMAVYATPSDARHHPASTTSIVFAHATTLMQKLRLDKSDGENEFTTGVANYTQQLLIHATLRGA